MALHQRDGEHGKSGGVVDATPRITDMLRQLRAMGMQEVHHPLPFSKPALHYLTKTGFEDGGLKTPPSSELHSFGGETPSGRTHGLPVLYVESGSPNPKLRLCTVSSVIRILQCLRAIQRLCYPTLRDSCVTDSATSAQNRLATGSLGARSCAQVKLARVMLCSARAFVAQTSAQRFHTRDYATTGRVRADLAQRVEFAEFGHVIKN
ncbi:hypothetical protein C8R43DRAFT_952892 [Mycena crocata]|nr:hypothetical protein C8R43DRAFT_952892 [Mycena crocata]